MMTIRLPRDTYLALKALAKETGETLEVALDKAVMERHRRVYLEGLAADYAELRRDPKEWEDLVRENELWDRLG